MDTALLRLCMKQQGVTIKKAAAELGIDESTYYRKMSTLGETFSVAQAKALASLLNLTKEDAIQIFLS